MHGPPSGGVHGGASGPAHRRIAAFAGPGRLRVTGRSDAVLACRVDVGRTTVAVYATDPSDKGGALGAADCSVIADHIDAAVRDGLPVVGIWHCSGAKISDGVGSLDGLGRVFAAITRASGRTPQISVVLGTSAGGAAYGAALTDVVVTAPDGVMFVTGPGVVAEVTGEQVSAAELGGPEVHAVTGVVHLTAGSVEQALAAARDLVGLLSAPRCDAGRERSPDPGLGEVLPVRERQAYDVGRLVRLLLDDDGPVVELQAQWARNLTTTFGRLGGRTVGVVANNPIHLAGCLDAAAADKAARFVQMCDVLGIPLLVIVDVPGYLPGVGQEQQAVLRRGAKLLHAFARASVPRVTLHTRKAYGGAYIAMNSRSLGATAVLAWPTAQIAVMGPEAAVQVTHRRELARLSPLRRREALLHLAAQVPTGRGLEEGLQAGYVDRVIAPELTAVAILEELERAAPGRGRHGNTPL